MKRDQRMAHFCCGAIAGLLARHMTAMSRPRDRRVTARLRRSTMYSELYVREDARYVRYAGFCCTYVELPNFGPCASAVRFADVCPRFGLQCGLEGFMTTVETGNIPTNVDSGVTTGVCTHGLWRSDRGCFVTLYP